ncbi:DUF4166 domain-containing protein [Leucobacter japonicus]|uniref:DUF4166 domain-containing protein n=1 Tax=Leucobacter japonicus TaxID=1461259 RepID=UPI001F4C9067|nr:DUF4166 domain-containing protein [Leucobacter japonicus]
MSPHQPPEPSSPYARALGALRVTSGRSESASGGVDALHPTLQQYFATIPEGHVGRGRGVFDRVGTPRRWLHPVLRLLERRGVVRATWARDVPFTVENRTIAGRAVGRRSLELPDGLWQMRDSVGLNAQGRLVDEIGEPATVVASFDLSAGADGVRLVSRYVGLVLFAHRGDRRRVLRLPRAIAPVVRLHERFDALAQRQRVDVTIDVPFFGRIYEYGGAFTYRIEEEY